MIEGLNRFLEGSAQPGLTELRQLIEELVGGGSHGGAFLGQDLLEPRARRVFRLRFAINGETRSVVIKRLKPEIARRNELVTHRWLPAVGLHHAGAPLLGSVAARNGACVWHVYEDLGEWELDPEKSEREKVQAAIELIASLHTRFAGHILIGEVRLLGGDLGSHFFETNLRDAISGLEALHPPSVKMTADQAGLRDRLLERLSALREQLPQRAHALDQSGGPETLLHGDLWAVNVFVIPTGTGLHARLIDWDHAAAGPASYDISTFLLRFPSQNRRGLLDLYRRAVERAGWQLADEHELNYLFETHEFARFANRVIWPTIALAMEGAPWGFEALAEVEQWFEQFEPVLPDETFTPFR